jgi:hypothetical protein
MVVRQQGPPGFGQIAGSDLADSNLAGVVVFLTGIDPLFKILAWFEMRHILTLFVDASLAGLRVSDYTCIAIMIGKTAETTNFYAPTGGQCIGHGLQHTVNSQINIFSRQLIQLM